MIPSCKLSCCMNSSSNKMLQIPLKWKVWTQKMFQIPLERQFPVTKCYKFHQNVTFFLENDRSQFKTIAKTVEMAVSSSKMLEINSKENGQKNKSKKSKRKTHNYQNNSGLFRNKYMGGVQSRVFCNVSPVSCHTRKFRPLGLGGVGWGASD